MDFGLPWVLILAGGDGVRLRPLTAHIVGDARPKQFCPLFDGETLLDRTRRRVALLTPNDRQVVVVTRAHEAYYRNLADDLAPDRLVVQPENRDTGPGILYPLLRIRHLAGEVPVAIFPSDHYVSDDRVFIDYVRRAVEVVRVRRDVVALMGIEPSSPETEYGWIEPAEGPLLADDGIFPIRRFVEKPSASLARQLFARRCLWNSFVMVGWIGTLLALVETAAPELVRAFEPVDRALGSAKEWAVLERVYARLPAVNFSRRVLAGVSGSLATIRASGLEWSDWGNPSRVIASLRGAGCRPSWLDRVEVQACVGGV
jgi:mannose-1-phosphate guanylyltransferase